MGKNIRLIDVNGLQKNKHKKCNIQHVTRQFTCSCGIPDAIRLCEGIEYCMKCGDKLSNDS